MGEGPIDLVIALGATGHVDLKWDEPVFEDFHRRLASFTRLIMFDPRGCGASDPLPHDAGFAWESWVEDVGAVMDAAGSERALSSVPSTRDRRRSCSRLLVPNASRR
jgi:hypothetical protein